MIFNLVHIKPSKVKDSYYLKSLNWTRGQKIKSIGRNGIEINSPLLIPSLENGIFSVENITAKFGIGLDKNNEKIFYETAKLKVISLSKNIDILIDNIDITTAIDIEATQQEFEFVNFKQELFKMQDTTKSQTFIIVIQIIANNVYANELYLKFHYRLSNNIGDVNGDGVVDLKDLVALSDHVIQGTPLSNPEFIKTNNNEEATPFDVIALSDRILNG